MNRRLALLTLLGLSLALFGCGGPSNTTFVTIGTGGVTGVYYPTGGAIATLVNRQQAAYGIKVSAESTGGSVYNINAVLSGDLEFGIAQSDRHAQAWTGTGDWDGAPQTALRSVFCLHPEVITLVAAEDSGIRSVADLKGKRVNLGNPGSGQRANALDVLKAYGIDPDRDLTAESLKAAEAPKMVQDGRIDAFFYTVGHPNGAINEATSGKRKVRFIPIDGEVAQGLVETFSYYATTVIGKDVYPMATNQEHTPSIGMVTTLVTAESVPEDVVYAITKEVMTHLEEFKTLHPALAVLQLDTIRAGLTAPLHPGAERYFREIGQIDP